MTIIHMGDHEQAKANAERLLAVRQEDEGHDIPRAKSRENTKGIR